MPDIFLSYNREDMAIARMFADAFAAIEFEVWWDATLKSGEAYDEVTEAALRTAKAVVVLWSRKSVLSRWVRSEATIGDRNKTLVPCMIEPCERPVMFELTQTAELGHWRGDLTDKAWLAFVADVRRLVGMTALPQATIAASQTPVTPQETTRPGQSGDAPSLAVLPFTNRSALAEDDVFAVGLVEDVISALSQGVEVRVLGSSATGNLVKGAVTDIAALGRRLGVRYLLEGNVRRVGPNLRVTAQLLEAETAEVVWTGKLDRPMSELADLQEELVLDLAATLNVEVFNLEIERALKKPSNLTAWQMVMRAQYMALSADPVKRAVAAVAEYERALAIAPDYALAIAALAVGLASAYISDGKNGLDQLHRAQHLANRAITLAPNDAAVLSRAGFALASLGNAAEGLRYTRRAVLKTPGSGLAHYYHGIASGVAGHYTEGLSHVSTAARLMPDSYMQGLIAYWKSVYLIELERLPEANDECEHLFTSSYGRVLKAQIMFHAGDEAQACEHLAVARRHGPPLSYLEGVAERTPFRGPMQMLWMANLPRLWAESGTAD